MRNPVFVAVTRISGPITRRIAATGLVPIWGVLHHRGRKSGKPYATPLAILATPNCFVLPLPWGEGTDWCRNLRAAGGGVIRWRGADHDVVQPEIIDSAAAAPALNAVVRPIARAVGIKRFVRVRRAVVGA